MNIFYFPKAISLQRSQSLRYVFVHELVHSLPLTSVHSIKLPAAVWYPWWDEFAGWNYVIAKTYVGVPSSILGFWALGGAPFRVWEGIADSQST